VFERNGNGRRKVEIGLAVLGYRNLEEKETHSDE
jgi:hypothetical protein